MEVLDIYNLFGHPLYKIADRNFWVERLEIKLDAMDSFSG